MHALSASGMLWVMRPTSRTWLGPCVVELTDRIGHTFEYGESTLKNKGKSGALDKLFHREDSVLQSDRGETT